MTESAIMIGATRGMEDVVSLVQKEIKVIHLYHSLADLIADPSKSSPLIIILQQTPDDFSTEDVSTFINRYPLNRLIVCQGHWCRSYGRTRKIWPASVCVPVEDFSLRFQNELQVLAGKTAPLPWTAGLDEIFSFDRSPENDHSL